VGHEFYRFGNVPIKSKAVSNKEYPLCLSGLLCVCNGIKTEQKGQKNESSKFHRFKKGLLNIGLPSEKQYICREKNHHYV
jgi:hypothetical protein